MPGPLVWLVGSVQLSSKDLSISTKEGDFVVDTYYHGPEKKRITVCILHIIGSIPFPMQKATILFDHLTKLGILDCK